MLGASYYEAFISEYLDFLFGFWIEWPLKLCEKRRKDAKWRGGKTVDLESGKDYLFHHSLIMTKVVIVATSATDLKGHATGLWIEEMAVPYYQFKNAGYEVVVSSPAGGPIPIDAGSMAEGFFTADAKKFMVGQIFGLFACACRSSLVRMYAHILCIYSYYIAARR